MAHSPPDVDLDQPLLPQVAGMDDAYFDWVHRSIKPKESLRIFRGDFLERTSHIEWWHVLVVWIPITLALFGYALFGRHLGLARVAWLGAVGLLAWTLLEYVLHRFVFHFRPRSAFGRRLHFLAHGVHHLDPWDPTRLVFPPLAALAIAIPVFLVIYLVCLLVGGADPLGTAVAVFAGLLVGYLIYDMTHYTTHHVRLRSRWGKYLTRYHLAHHHKHPQRLYGVSSPLWDVVFRTGWPKTR